MIGPRAGDTDAPLWPPLERGVVLSGRIPPHMTTQKSTRRLREQARAWPTRGVDMADPTRRNPDIMTGQRYGRLVVLDPSRRAPKSPSQYTGERAAECRCDCGVLTVARWSNLRREKTTSCGCLRSEQIAARGKATATHSMTGHALYQTWVHMIDRCANVNAHNYRWYGARGIAVHEAWQCGPVEFIAYVEGAIGPRPDGMTLDRIDNDRGYQPGNLRWATPSTQAANRRTHA